VDGSLYQVGVRALADLTHDHFETACREHLPYVRLTMRHMERFLEETGRLAPRLLPPATPLTVKWIALRSICGASGGWNQAQYSPMPGM
jgi:hypothetical protein